MRQQFAALKSARHALARNIKQRVTRVYARTSPIVYPKHQRVTETMIAAGVCTPLKGHKSGKQAWFIRQHFKNNIFANLYCESELHAIGCSTHHEALPSHEWHPHDNSSLDMSATYHAWKYCAGEDMR